MKIDELGRGVQFMQKNEIVIWGTGRIAEIAYYYYRENCNIAFFVDSDRNRWEGKFLGLPIRNPEVLRDNKCKVILAFQAGKQAVKNILNNEYGIDNVVEFGVEEKVCTSIGDNSTVFSENVIVVGFSGGLGNQLFQYSLVNAFKSRGKKTIIDASYYYRNTGVMGFELNEAFDITDRIVTDITFPNDSLCKELMDSNETKNYVIYKEPTIFEQDRKEADISLMSITGGYIKGMFQTYYFANSDREGLLENLRFRKIPEVLITEFNRVSENHTLVSVHMRRGDYLTERNTRIYGNICTEKYYENAFDFFRSKYDDVMFCLFSDDISFVENKYGASDCFCIDRTLVAEYKDWFDLFFMSQCKHNIIANSTFSWWGAMLNRNSDKIVVAPNGWVNGCKYLDIYPNDWILMEG